MKTVNLQLSKELKEAGYPQKNAGVYWKPIRNKFRLHPINGSRFAEDYIASNFGIASPTADEILEQLPKRVEMKYGLDITNTLSNGWLVCYVSQGLKEIPHHTLDASLANAAAKCWLHLKKEALI